MDSNTKTAGLGDISMIRDILMGQHISEFESRLAEVNGRIQQLEQDLRKSMQEQEDRSNQRFSKLTEEMNERFSRLQKTMDDGNKMLDDKINRTSKADKAIIGAMLVQIGKELIGEKK